MCKGEIRCSGTQSCSTLCDPMDCSIPGEVSLANSQPGGKKKSSLLFLSKIFEEYLIDYRYLGSNEEINMIIVIKHDNLL